jgi:glycosyltransferase involved in cell wall biosynthesis
MEPVRKLARVVILVENLPVPNDRRVWQEARTLKEAGYQVSIVSITGPGANKYQEVREGVRIYRYPAPPVTHGTLSFLWEFSYCWVMSFFWTLWIGVRHGIDIIQACNPPETFWLIGAFWKLWGVRFLFDHHDLSPEMYVARFGKKGLAYRMLLRLEKASYRTADAVLVSSNAEWEIARKRGGVDPNKLFLLLSGPHPMQMKAGTPEPALKMGRAYLLCYVGVLNPQDGGETLIRLADYFLRKRHFQDFFLAILGDGDNKNRLESLARELGVSDHIAFTGWADTDLMRRYLSTADLCLDCMPKNEYSDAAMLNKILEYMAFSRPIAMFDLTEAHSAAGDAAWYAADGSLESYANGILDLLADPERRLRMGTIGRQRILEIINWEKQKASLFAAYEMALAPKKSHGRMRADNPRTKFGE